MASIRQLAGRPSGKNNTMPSSARKAWAASRSSGSASRSARAKVWG